MASFDLLRFPSPAQQSRGRMVGLVFVTSGWSHATHVEARSKSIGMSKPFTLFLGVAEFCGGIAVAIGFLTQYAAIGLILVMLGAIYKKMFVWHTGFWGEKASGWHYDLLFVVMNIVILVTDGGHYILWH